MAHGPGPLPGRQDRRCGHAGAPARAQRRLPAPAGTSAGRPAARRPEGQPGVHLRGAEELHHAAREWAFRRRSPQGLDPARLGPQPGPGRDAGAARRPGAPVGCLAGPGPAALAIAARRQPGAKRARPAGQLPAGAAHLQPPAPPAPGRRHPRLHRGHGGGAIGAAGVRAGQRQAADRGHPRPVHLRRLPQAFPVRCGGGHRHHGAGRAVGAGAGAQRGGPHARRRRPGRTHRPGAPCLPGELRQGMGGAAGRRAPGARQ